MRLGRYAMCRGGCRTYGISLLWHMEPVGNGIDALILTADSCQSGLSNELGANGKINYLKNIIGLWLIQESRREYKRRGQAYSFAELEQQALAAEPLRSFIDPDAPEFVAPATCRAEYRNFAAKPASPSRKRWGP